jgi:hypothetical protein
MFTTATRELGEEGEKIKDHNIDVCGDYLVMGVWFTFLARLPGL